jgi:hypothetical protein
LAMALGEMAPKRQRRNLMIRTSLNYWTDRGGKTSGNPRHEKSPRYSNIAGSYGATSRVRRQAKCETHAGSLQAASVGSGRLLRYAKSNDKEPARRLVMIQRVQRVNFEARVF